MTRVTYGWQCADCGESGSGPRSDKAAERHTSATGHSTRAYGTPEEDA
jgi:hypothetical protein